MTPPETPVGSCFCFLCRKIYMKKEVHDHMQGMLHHRELEHVMGRDCYHQCQACQVSIKGLNDFAKHISTSEHGVKMKTLCRLNKKPLTLEKYLDKALIIQIHARNKELRKIAKKEKSKKKKLDLIMQKNLKKANSEKQKTPSLEKEVKPSLEKEVKPSLEKEVKPSLEKKVKPSQEKKVKPSQEKKVKPLLEKKVKPSLEKKVKPSQEKKVKPSQEKKVKPSQEKKVKPSLEKKVKPSLEKKVKPSLEKKVKPSLEKKVKPSLEKKVKPSQEKKVKPSLEKKVTPTQMKEKIQKKPLPVPIPKKKTPKQSLQIKNGEKAQNKENRLAGKLTPHKQWVAQPSRPKVWELPEYTSYLNHEYTTAWIHCTDGRYGTQNGTDKDFTSDHLPSSGALIFNNCPDKDLPSTSAPVPPSRLQDNTSGPSQDDNTSPVRNLDVPAMLRQVKRALGVREPCRGSPATPTQGHSRGAEAKGEALGSRIHSGGVKEDRAERAPRSELIQLATSLHSAAVSKPASLPSSSTSFVQSPQVSTSNSVPKGGMPLPPLAGSRAQLRTRKDKAEKNTPLSNVSREMISDNNRPCSGETEPLGDLALPRLGALALPTSLSRHVGKAVAHEPNLNAARRIRNVGEARKGEGEKVAGLKPTLKKLLSSAGSQRKVNWKEMYQEANRKKQETIKGMPRFGIEMVNPLCDPDGLTLDEDEDLPLAEGFQWEAAFPDGPLLPPAQPSLPSAPESTPGDDVARQQQAEASTQHMEQPSTTSRTSKPSAPVTVKTEALEKQYGHAGGVNDTCDEQSKISVRRKEKKRKLDSELTDTSSLNHCVKKRKANKSKNDQVQVDELLAVSLREEELSSSMHSVDSSLIQARNVLQSAYSEVQRLLVVKQQVTAEINKLRAKRIDILQGMQGGYSGGSGMEEDCVEPGLAAATVPSTQHPQILPLSIPHIASPVLAPTIPSPAFPNLVTSLPSLTPTHLTSSMPILNTLQPAPSNSPTLSIKHERVSSHSQDLLRNSHLVQAAMQVTHNIAPQMSSPTVLHPLPKYSSIIPVPLPTPLPMPSTLSLPAVPLDNQQRAENSSSGGPLPLLKTVREYKEKMIMKLKQEYEESTCSESEEDLVLISSVDGKPGLGARVSEKEIEEVDSDSSVETEESTSGSDLEIVAIDDSDVEDDLGAHVPVGHNPSKSLTEVCVGVSSSSTQTAVRTEDQKNIKLKTEHFNSKDQLSPVPVKDQNISSGSADVAEEEEPSLGSFEGNTSLVHDLQIHGGLLYTCSGHTAQAYSLVTRECQAVFEGHTNKVNCLLVFSLPGLPARLYTGSSDRTIRCYSIKSKKCLELISLPDRILCLHICWKILYVGLANGSVVSIDLKTQRLLDTLECHGPRGVSCLDTAQEGARRVLLVGSYDSSISVRDARSGLLLRTLEGHTKTVLCMKVVNDLVFSGSSDRSVHAHNIHTGELVRIYKGHGHAVTALAILGKVMVTACLDKLVRVYELHSHDRLQVYGGHSDMVMCMAIHKSVIYTGCYDGSVQAVRLNLMCNHRCWWHGCTLIFGVTEHLLKHLLNDHGNPGLQTFKCRWRGCSSFFATQDSCKLDLPRHMQIHIAKDSKLET